MGDFLIYVLSQPVAFAFGFIIGWALCLRWVMKKAKKAMGRFGNDSD